MDLWEHYNQQYLNVFPNPQDSLFVSYDNFIRNPEHEMESLCQGLIELGVLENSDIDLTDALDTFSPALINSGNYLQGAHDNKIMTSTQLSLESYLSSLGQEGDTSGIDSHELIQIDPALSTRIKDFSETFEPLSKALENLQRLIL